MTMSRIANTVLLASTLLSPVFAQADKSLVARIQRIEDVEQIQRVLLDYGRSLDAHDFAAYSRLFAKDGEWVGGFGSVHGPAAIQAFMEKNIGPINKPGATYHLLSNFEIDVHGDTATVWSRWAYVIPGPDKKPAIAQGGHYDDAFVRENGQWKFQRRVAVTDVPHFDPTEQK